MTAKQAAQNATEGSRVYTVTATARDSGEEVTLSYRQTAVAGHGSFGVVAKAELVKGAMGIVALKRTKQDRRFKNREMQIMCSIRHPNIVKHRFFWYELSQESEDELFLNLVLEYVPETLYRVYRTFTKRKERMPELLIKLYVYQTLRALAFVHSVGICHRDVKPHNLMCDAETGRLVLIDFGSAKVLKPGEPNVAYTCSRYYRAPELIFGATQYQNSIDLWAVGCILGEVLGGSVFFPGTSGIDQLVEIIKVLGTPTAEEVNEMNPHYTTHRFPQLLPYASPAAIDLLSALLVFTPTDRLAAIEAMCHPFFDELRAGNALPRGAQAQADGASGEGGEGAEWGLRMPNGMDVKVDLFDFSAHELSIRPDLIPHLVPPHAERALRAGPEGIDLANFEPLDLRLAQVRID
ncbi:regulator of ime2 [Rhodotorula kratochvilovae]